jgi:hypothetical protein
MVQHAAPTGPRRSRTELDSLVELVPALLVFALIALRAQSLMSDGDTYLHIAAGQWMWAHHAIIYTDPFSYTLLGHPWLTHEWLSEVVMAIVFGLGSWQALDLLFAFAAAATAFLLARALLRYLNPIPAAVIQQLALVCIFPHLLMRPHALALPLLIAWTYGLLIARDEKRGPHLALLPLMVLWANLHGSFVVGLFLVAVFGLEAAVEAGKTWRQALRPWLVFGVGATIAAALTPHGLAGLIFPFQLAASPALLRIWEWQSSTFPRVTPLEVFLLATFLLFMLRPTRVPLVRLLLFLLLVHMTLEHRRHLDVLATVGPMVLARSIADALNSGARTAIDSPKVKRQALLAPIATVLAFLLIAGIRLVVPEVPADSSVTPRAALNHVPATLAQRPVFNDEINSGYLIFRGIRPFIDMRAEMYGPDYTANYAKVIQPDRHAMESTFSKYNVSWTILTPDNPANEILDVLPGWRVLYKDAFAVVRVRGDSQDLTSAGSRAATP